MLVDNPLPEGWYIAFDADNVPYYYTEGGANQREVPTTAAV